MVRVIDLARPPAATTTGPPKKKVSSLRQFAALSKKNWLLKKRKPWSLLLELLLPLAFMALMGVLKNSGSPKKIQPAINDPDSYPVPSLAFLAGQSVATAAQPNALCFDDNLFTRCGCAYERPPTATIKDDSIDKYFNAGLQFPIEALFSSAHSFKAYVGVCTGIVSAIQATTAAAQICEYIQVATDLCPRLLSQVPPEFTAAATACPGITPPAKITTMAQATTIINAGIKISEDVGGAGVSVPAAEFASVCKPVFLALAPLRNDLLENTPGLEPAEAMALAYYKRLSAAIGPEKITNFTSESAVTDYVKQNGYSKRSDIPLMGPAIVFQSGGPAYSYTIRSNLTMESDDDGYRGLRVPMTERVVDTSFRTPYSTDNFQGYDIYPANQMYYTSGVLSLQQDIDSFLLTQASPTSSANLQYSLGNFPSEEYSTDDFWSSVGDMFAIVMVLVLMYPVSNVIKSLVVDKELKLKEGMLQMGLGPKVYTLAWVFQFTIIFFILAILLTAIGANSVFKNSSKPIVFVFFMLFLLATIAFCFFLASFFSKARSASTYGSLIFFLTVLPYFAVSSPSSSSGGKLLASILPSTGFAVGILPFADYEDSGQGVTADTISTSNKYNITMAQVLGMFIFDIIFYSFLAWYAGQVVKSEWGTSKPWYFLVTKKYWRPEAAAKDDRDATDAAMQVDETQSGRTTIEAVAESLKRQIADKSCVALRGLTKTYKSPNGEPFNAVDAMDLTMYRGQITALLGHNGAGKTTTMSMLTGMIPVTSGRAVINGLDVRTQMSKVREDLGVCPQHDVLYPDLTVTEHLRMFATFKGVPSKSIASEVDTMLRSVGLVEKRNEKSAGLSGGQKRKLSVGIAFIGGSRVVFLDEPTSGMDPHSRRFTWDVIRKQKEGRVIVLSTHFMDEADILSDRIAIMASGKLRCCGSSLFLKNLYGVGYNLTVVKTISNTYEEDGTLAQPDAATLAKLAGASKGIRHLVRDHVPKAEVLSDVGAEISFQLPSNASASFKALLMDIDAHTDDLCVSSYGMSVTTLEEVFIRVAHGTEDPEARTAVSVLRQRSASDVNKKGFNSNGDPVVETKSDVPDVPYAMTATAEGVKRLQRQRSDSTLANTEPVVKTVKPVQMTPATRFKTHVRALVAKRAVTFKRDKKMVCFTLLAPSLFLLLGMVILLATGQKDQPALVLDVGDYNPKSTSVPRNPVPFGQTCTVGTGVTCNVAALSAAVPVNNTALGVGVKPAAAVGNVAAMSTFLQSTANTESDQSNYYGAYVWDAVDFRGLTNEVRATVQTNYTAMHGAPTFANLLSNTLIKRAAGPAAGITTTIHPLPSTKSQNTLNKDVLTFPTVLFLMIGFAFIPAAWVGYIVREREQKTKHQQVVSGVSLNAYWISTFLWDMTSFILTPLIAIILLLLFKADSIVGTSSSALACFLLLFFWGPANMGFSYCTSFFFTKHAGAMTSTLFLNWVLGLLAPLAIFFMLFFDSTRTAAKALKWILRCISPAFCLGDGLLNLGNRNLLTFVFELDAIPGPFDVDIALADILFMVAGVIFYGGLTLWLERLFSGTRTIMSFFSDRKLKSRMGALKDPAAFWDSDLTAHANVGAVTPIEQKKRGWFGRKSKGISSAAVNDAAAARPGDVPVLIEDKDVVAERRRMQAPNGVSDVIQIQGLRKVYPASSGLKVAVRNMWLGIPKGQCFGLLGINGAGKTTAISTLCGEQTPTEGRATLAGVDVATNPEEVYRLIGYCPQFDALFDTMTAREHLQLYARIKGIPNNLLNEAVTQKLQEMDLTYYADKLAGGFSGGNKRKLSVACAMLGAPEIVFLDEPSTGVDPVAKRSMWDVISRIVTTNKECALILTTHSMDECESLSNRIGIMVGGRLQCLGSAQQLKSRFGSGYQLETTAALPSEAALSDATNALLDSAALPRGTEILTGEQQVVLALKTPYPDLQGEIIPLGKGALLHHELMVHGYLQARDVAAWAQQESVCTAVMTFASEHFKGAELLEKQGGKLRLALPPQPGMSLGAIFGLIEENRRNLGIGDYALGQTSLEQIFNTFAQRQAEETAVAPGRGAIVPQAQSDANNQPNGTSAVSGPSLV